jgi:dihydrofolate synthase/folylpolyglutamate synthase
MRPEILRPEDAFRWAEGFTNLETGKFPFDKRNYRLDRMAALLAMLGNPERAYGIVHVAGTKGKGSTAALMASVLEASGRKTGLYTSPHVATPLERIAVSGRFPDAARFVGLAAELARTVDGLPPQALPGGFPPTTFELYTLFALLAFRAEGCAIAVVETGIGGRLDATNVVSPVASVITPLDLEHTDVLGDTIDMIAGEKAGIIKPGAPAFVGFQPPETKKVFRAAAARAGTRVRFLDEELEELDSSMGADGTAVRLKLRGMRRLEFRLSLLGRFQAENAALACLTLMCLFPGLPDGAFTEGFAHSSLPGRFEVLRGSPPLIADAAHTPLAVRRLLESFREIFPGDAVLIFGSVAGKKPREMAEILAPAFRSIFVSTPGTFKESDPEGVARIFAELNPETALVRDPAQALRAAEEAAGGRLPVLVTCSFYMVAEIRRLIQP